MNIKIILGSLLLILVVRLSADEKTLPQLYKQLLPSVVTLHTFQNKISGNITTLATSPNGLGSGVIISKDGLIVTASHVVHLVDGLHVEFENGVRKRAKVVSSLPWADLALIKVAEDELPTSIGVAKLGDSKKTAIGEQIFVIGAPLGINRTLTVGYISGIHPIGSRPSAPMAEFFQTDAAINPGNSGGPMFNMSGEIIGIASHIQTQSGGSQGLGFTVTSDSVKQLLLKRGRFWSGIEILPLSPLLSKIFHLPQNSGILVQRVANGSMGQKAGLQGGTVNATIEDQPVLLGGDIILSINGHMINSKKAIKDIMRSFEEMKPGTYLKFVLWRHGKKLPLVYQIPYQN